MLREVFLTIGEIALLLLFPWCAAWIFQFLRGLIFGPPIPKKDERDD